MSLFIIVEEGVEFPSPNGGVSLAVGSDMMSSLKVGSQLGLGFRGGKEFVLGIGIMEGGRVPFLARGLVLLVSLIALAVEGFASYFGLVEIAAAATFSLAVEGVDTGRGDYLGHKIGVVLRLIIMLAE